MKNILPHILTITILFLIPFGAAFWYIQKITIEIPLPKIKGGQPGICSNKTNIDAQYININASTTDYNFKKNPELEVKNLDQTIEYLKFFNIKSDLIRHSLSLDNSIKAEISYKKSGANEKYKNIFESIIPCDGKIIESKRENDNNVLIKSNLALSQESISNDRKYIDEIITTCVKSPNIAFKNNLGYQIIIDFENSIKITEDSYLKLIIEPETKSKIIIYFGFFIFWIGFLVLLKEGTYKFYLYLYGKIAKTNSKK